jgi:integrase
VIGREQYLDEHELELLLRTVQERSHVSGRRHRNAERDHAMFALLCNLGMRPGELLKLRIKDIHLRNPPWLRIHRLKRRRELGVIDDLPLSATLTRMLKRYLDHRTGDAESRAFPVSMRQAERLFTRYCARAGLPPYYHLYCLRHSAATRALALCGDIKQVQVLLGHASIRTTAIYAHIPQEQRRELSERIGNLV